MRGTQWSKLYNYMYEYQFMDALTSLVVSGVDLWHCEYAQGQHIERVYEEYSLGNT